MIGFGANRRGGRLPSFILIFLMVVIGILSFNYWTVSGKHGRLLDELLEVQTQVKRTDGARSRLEKRNTELMVQVDTYKKQVDQKDGEYGVLEGRMKAQESLHRKCADDKMKMDNDALSQQTEMLRMKEQLKELKQEVMRLEEQLREVKKNSTTLEQKLEYESSQCGYQIAQLKHEYEESKNLLEEEASRLRKSLEDSQKAAAVGRRADNVAVVETGGERHSVTTKQLNIGVLKDELGKPGSDAGMPGIEDSEVGKNDADFALKKPAITKKQDDAADAGVGAGGGADDGPGLPGLSLDLPRLQMQDRVEVQAVGALPPNMIKQADKPVVFEEDNKAGIKADEIGEQQRQIQAPDSVKHADVRAIAMPPNPAQVPRPIQPRHAKDPLPGDIVHHRQSRFFDENESPVDPQHGSKLADYNGDDGNVGEYEADKQAELAYNEEEDGDGGEEDVQDDDDRDMQGERPGDYGKRHQGNDI